MLNDFHEMIKLVLYQTFLNPMDMIQFLLNKLVINKNDKKLKSIRSIKSSEADDSRSLFQNQNILLQKVKWK